MSRLFSNPSAVVWALVDALAEDPFYAAITVDYAADVIRRREILARYFDYSLTEGFQFGRRVLLREPAAAAIWLLPVSPEQQATQDAAKAHYLATRLGPLGNANYHHILQFMQPRAAALIGESAWYLSIAGVNPAAQGQGAGARLLAPTLAEADAAGVGCYLETFSSRSRRFYERLGFGCCATHLEPVTGAEYAIMFRALNQPGGATGRV